MNQTMPIDEAFKWVAKNANVSKSVEVLKSKRPTERQLQSALESMVANGVRLDIAREALWTVEEYFDKEKR
jgi:hypothetical protein